MPHMCEHSPTVIVHRLTCRAWDSHIPSHPQWTARLWSSHSHLNMGERTWMLKCWNDLNWNEGLHFDICLLDACLLYFKDKASSSRYHIQNQICRVCCFCRDCVLRIAKGLIESNGIPSLNFSLFPRPSNMSIRKDRNWKLLLLSPKSLPQPIHAAIHGANMILPSFIVQWQLEY